MSSHSPIARNWQYLESHFAAHLHYQSTNIEAYSLHTTLFQINQNKLNYVHL